MGELTCSTPGEYVQPKIIEQLKMNKDRLNEQLEEVERAISILDKNPELSDLLTIIRRNF